MITKIYIDDRQVQGVINGELHSQFIEMLGWCIEDGIWVGEDSDIPNIHGIRKAFVEAMQEISPPVIRWPGGCYADTYHWRDGIGPRDQRPVTFNENFATYELDNHAFGIHEFMELCRLVGAKPWLNINMLSGSVQEMKDWMEYCNREDPTDLMKLRQKNGAANDTQDAFHVEYWGIGNEPWCGGGNHTAGSYVNEYRKYATAAPSFRKDLFKEPEQKMYLIIAGPDGNKPKESRNWTRDIFRELGTYRCPPVNGMDLHFYNWNIQHPQDTDTTFDRDGWYRVIHNCFELESVINEQYDLIQEGLSRIPDPEVGPGSKPSCDLLVGEWGNWHGNAFMARPALFQQVTMRDAITSALTLDIFHRNCDKVRAACVAQTVNVLNALFLTDREHFVRTPNYDVFQMYKVHRGASLIESRQMDDQEQMIYSLASLKDGIMNINLVNIHMDQPEEVRLYLPEGYIYLGGRTLSSDRPDNYNSWEQPDLIRSRESRQPLKQDLYWSIHVPAASVNVLQFKYENV